MFSFRACMTETVLLIILVLGFISDHIFLSKEDKLFFPVFAFHKSMSNAIYDLVLYLQSEGLNFS